MLLLVETECREKVEWFDLVAVKQKVNWIVLLDLDKNVQCAKENGISLFLGGVYQNTKKKILELNKFDVLVLFLVPFSFLPKFLRPKLLCKITKKKNFAILEVKVVKN